MKLKFSRDKNSIFCDMDGVVADFDVFMIKNFGKTFPHQSGPTDPTMWKFLESVQNLYYQLELTPYAKVLLDALLAVGCPVAMLTAIPRRSTIPEAESDKRRWMSEKLAEYKIPVLIGPFSRDKQNHITHPGDILIDDRSDNIARWIAAGGIGILHVGIEQTLNELGKHTNG